MTTTKLLPLTTFVAAAMSFAIPAWADGYTYTGDSTIGTDLLCYFEDANDDASAMKLGEKMLDEDALTSLYASHAASSDSNSFSGDSMPAFSGTEILERVEITKGTSSTFNGALTLASATNSYETVTVRQSAVATMSLSSDNSTEQYAGLGKSYYEQVSTSNSGSAVTTYSTVSILGNFDSVGDGNGSYGTSTIDSGIVPFAASNRTWTGGNDNNEWSGNGNWNGSTWTAGDNATFNANGGENTTVTVDVAITAGTITVTGNTDYIFEYAEGASLEATGNVTIGDSSGSGTLTIKGGTNTFSGSYVYVGYSSNSSGTLTIEGGTNIFSTSKTSKNIYVGYGQYSSGTLTIEGGTNTFSSNIRVGCDKDSEGAITISGGENNFSYVFLGYGQYSSGTLTIKDGTNTFSGSIEVGYGKYSEGAITISGGENNNFYAVYLGYGQYSSGLLTIETGTNIFSNYVYLGYGKYSSGTLTIKGGTNEFQNTVFAGADSTGTSSSGTLTIEGGTNIFSGFVYLGQRANSTATFNINGGTNTFLSQVYVGEMGTVYVTITNGINTFTVNVLLGYDSGSAGTLKISGGTNTFSNNIVNVGNVNGGAGTLEISGGRTEFSSSLNIRGGTVTISGGTTTISGTTTIADNDGSLTIGGGSGTATVYLEQQIGTTTTGSVTISDNANIILSGALLDSIAALLNSNEGGSVVVIEANSITINGTTLLDQDNGALATIIGSSISADGYELTWSYDGAGTLSVVAAAAASTPEPSMFGMLFGLSALGLVATRRRRRKA